MGLAWLACESLDPPQGRHGFTEQIFGSDEQAPKGGCGRCPKNAVWTSELRKSFKEGFGSTRNAERKGRTPTLNPLC
jgi:hypothetical protein